MGLFNIGQMPKPPQIKPKRNNPTPQEVLFRYTMGGQVLWYNGEGKQLLDEGFKGNNAVFTVMDWVGKKIAQAPIVLYTVRDTKALTKYKSLMQQPDKHFTEAMIWKNKALAEVEDPNHEILRVLKRPNELMPSWAEFAYGSYVFKTANGSYYWMGTRSGSVMDPTKGKIGKLTLLPSHYVGIRSGGMMQPIESYFLLHNEQVKIPAENVGQGRNFSPDYDNEIDWLRGMPALYPLRKIIQKHNEATETEASLYKKKGLQDIVFNTNTPENSEVNFEQFQKTRDVWDKKLNSSEPGSILINSDPLGVIRVGFSPTDLGLTESNKVSKADICAALHTQAIIHNWSEQTTYNNMDSAVKMSLTDAVLPELRTMAETLNSWFLPSYDASGRYFLDFDLDVFPELQEKLVDKVKYLEKIPLSSNEFRAACGWDEDTEHENMDEPLIPSGKQMVSKMGLDPIGGQVDTSMYEQDQEDPKNPEPK